MTQAPHPRDSRTTAAAVDATLPSTFFRRDLVWRSTLGVYARSPWLFLALWLPIMVLLPLVFELVRGDFEPSDYLTWFLPRAALPIVGIYLARRWLMALGTAVESLAVLRCATRPEAELERLVARLRSGNNARWIYALAISLSVVTQLMWLRLYVGFYDKKDLLLAALFYNLGNLPWYYLIIRSFLMAFAVFYGVRKILVDHQTVDKVKLFHQDGYFGFSEVGNFVFSFLTFYLAALGGYLLYYSWHSAPATVSVDILIGYWLIWLIYGAVPLYCFYNIFTPMRRIVERKKKKEIERFSVAINNVTNIESREQVALYNQLLQSIESIKGINPWPISLKKVWTLQSLFTSFPLVEILKRVVAYLRYP